MAVEPSSFGQTPACKILIPTNKLCCVPALNNIVLPNQFNDLLVQLGADKLERQDYFTASKKKNEIKFENNSKEQLSSVLVMILQNWKQHIYYLNTEENRYLAELRDALLPELMSGKIDL